MAPPPYRNTSKLSTPSTVPEAIVDITQRLKLAPSWLTFVPFRVCDVRILLESHQALRQKLEALEKALRDSGRTSL